MARTLVTGNILRSGSIPPAALPAGTITSSVQLANTLPVGTVSSSTQVSYTQLQNIPTNIVSSSTQVTAFLPNGTVSSSTQLPAGIASSSAQVTSYLPTDTVSSSAQVTTFLPAGTISSSVQVDFNTISNKPTLVSGSAQIDVRNTTGITTIATTGSNTFTGVTAISDTTNSTSYLDGALTVAGGMSVQKDMRISGSMTINGLLTVVSMSSQYVTSSQYNLGVSKVTVNDDDNVRFAGLSVYDSGSSNATASIYWDSLQHRFLYENLSGSLYNSAIIIAGPKNTGSLGQERGLITGSIPYATGDDHIDNSVMYQSGSNIGIGVTNPSATLDVQTTSAVGAIKITATTGTNGSAIQTTNTGGSSYFGKSNSTGGAFGGAAYATVVYGGGDYPLEFYTNDVERVRITNVGNVGIGITSPLGKLGISGSATTTIIIPRASNGSTASPAETQMIGSTFTNGTYEAGIYAVNSFINNSGNWLSFKTTDTGNTTATRMTIDSSGNVGIGVTTPSSFGVRLAVSAAANVYGDERKVAALIDTTALAAGVGAGISFYGVAESGGGTAQFGSIKGIKENATSANYAGALVFVTGNSSNVQTERVRIDSSGRVGIGTTIPTQADLHVSRGSSYANIRMGNGAIAGRDNASDTYWYSNSTTTETYLVNGQASLIGQYLGEISFYTTSSGTAGNAITWGNPKMKLTVDGNLGIAVGSLTPYHKLQVGLTSGQYAHFGGLAGTNATYAGISLGYTEGASYTKTAIVQEQIADGAARGHLHFLVDTAADGNSAVLGDSKMMIHGTTGNVGIGTNGPKHKLHVNGTVQVGYVDALNDAMLLSWNGASSYGSIQTFSSSNLALNPSGNNVGIGTTNPNAKLHIVDGNNSIKMGDLNGVSTAVIALTDGAEVQVEGYSNQLRLNTSGSTRLTVAYDGGIGIGTTDPAGYKLNVNGTLNVNGVATINSYAKVTGGTFTIAASSTKTVNIATSDGDNVHAYMGFSVASGGATGGGAKSLFFGGVMSDGSGHTPTTISTFSYGDQVVGSTITTATNGFSFTVTNNKASSVTWSWTAFGSFGTISISIT